LILSTQTLVPFEAIFWSESTNIMIELINYSYKIGFHILTMLTLSVKLICNSVFILFLRSEEADTDLEQQVLHQVVKKSMESLWKLVCNTVYMTTECTCISLYLLCDR